MKRKFARVLLIVLFAGAIIRPMLHLGHGYTRVGREGHHKAHHHLAHGPCCKLIHEPINEANLQIKYHVPPAVYILINHSPRLEFAAVLGGIEQARAPPVA